VKETSVPQRLLSGERRAVARMISWAENADPRFPAALAAVYAGVGRAWRTGVTGPPGAGKSTLVNELVRLLRAGSGSTDEGADSECQVGVLAIDPSSPFSGGALLGDRIRMEELITDPGVFIRSMASRGSHGGMARAAVDASDVMDAAGFAEVLIETVGVGQAEYDIVEAADTVVVVLCPGAGDGIQAMKAGLLEVADVLVVNKMELDGAERLESDLSEAVHTRDVRTDGWEVPVVSCSAGRADGVDRVLDAVRAHREFLSAGDLEGLRREKRSRQVRRVVGERLEEALWGPGGRTREVDSALATAATPYDVADQILGRVLAGVLDSQPRPDTDGPNNERATEEARG
jgi:LAO/AO transport system kinase